MVCSKILNATGKFIPSDVAGESMDINSTEVQIAFSKFNKKCISYAIEEDEDGILDTVDKLLRTIIKYLIKIMPENDDDSILTRMIYDKENLLHMVVELEPFVIKSVINILDMYYDSNNSKKSDVEEFLYRVVIYVPVYRNKKIVSITPLNNF